MPPSTLTDIYLSPHLDDAVLSCGGSLHRQTERGGRAVVVTLCTAAPPPGPLSPFAQELHDRWAEGAPRSPSPAEMAARRRAEDLAALGQLQAEAVHLDVPDCIYRRNPATGLPLYPSRNAIFGSLHAAELTLVRRIATKLATLLRGFGRHHLFVPLGLGQHVDHQLARRAAEVAGGIYAYYEDFPYAAQNPRWPDPAFTQAHERPLTAEITPLTASNLAGKVSAIAQYTSQISSFWPDLTAMDTAVHAFAERTGGGSPAERVWRVG